MPWFDLSHRLIRGVGTVRIRPHSITPLESGNVLVLGFPALRGASARQTRGPGSDDGELPPNVGDIYPLIAGSVDTRLDDLRQWIVNLIVRSSASRESRELLDLFTKFFSSLVPGGGIAFHGVNRESWAVEVSVNGTVVPLALLSQGMSSIFNWAGMLLQRLEHFRRTSGSSRGRVLVLIDEIDAHLHPAWQRTLVRIVRNQFPEVQFVVTSHSALIVSSLNRNEIWILDREGKATRPPHETQGTAADDILLDLFALPDLRDPAISQAVQRLSQLRSERRTPATRAEIDALETRLKQAKFASSNVDALTDEISHQVNQRTLATIDGLSTLEKQRLAENLRRLFILSNAADDKNQPR